MSPQRRQRQGAWAARFTLGDALVLLWARTVALNRGRAILALPITFAGGTGLYFFWPVEPPLGITLFAFLAGLALFLWFGVVDISRNTVGWMRVALLLLALSAGHLSAQAGALSRQHDVLARETNPFKATSFVENLERRDEGIRLTLVGLVPERDLRTTLPDRVRVTVRKGGAAIMPGDRVSALMVLRPPPPPIEPGAFDYARQLYFEQIGALGFTLGEPDRLEGGEIPSLRIGLARFRVGLADRIQAQFGDPATGALAAALLTGERAAIPEPVLEDLRIAGLAHLLAISGLHMGLVAGALFFVLRFALALMPRLAVRYPIKKWAALGALMGGLGYLILSGASIPSQRAFIMVGVGFLAVVIDRVAISMRLVAFAAFLVLALQPDAILSAGFHMSFAAVAALVAVYESLRDRPDSPLNRTGQNRFVAYTVGLVLTSLVAGLATLPFAAYHFGRVSDYGLVANLLAVPLMGAWVMPTGLISLFAMPFGLEAWPLQAMGWGIDFIRGVAHWVAGLPGSEWGVKAASPTVLLALGLGLVWAVAWRGPVRFVSVIVFGFALGLWITTPRPDILISEDGGLVAVRGDDGGLVYSSLRRAKFTREQWQRHDGDIQNKRAGPARCDRSGCAFAGPAGQGISYVTDWAGLVEECRTAGVLITPLSVPARLCPDALVLDRWDMKEGGAHALRYTASGWVIDRAQDHRGDRLWSMSAPSSRN